MKLEKFNAKKYFIGIGVFLVVLLCFYHYQHNKFKNITKNAHFTVGYIIGIKKYNRGDDYYRYNYNIKGENYEKGIGSSSSNNLFVGKKYLVIFETGNPDNSMLLPFIMLPDSTKNVPKEGWKEPPVLVNMGEIKWFLENY